MVFHTTLVRRGLEETVRFPWDVSIVTFMAFPELLKSDEGAGGKIARLARDPFFDMLEVAPMREEEWTTLLKEVERTGRGIKFAAGLQPDILVRKYNPSSLDEDERARARDVLLAGTRQAGERGFKAVAFCSGPNVPEGKVGESLKSFGRTVEEVAELASKHGLKVFIETFDTDKDKKRLIGSLDMAVKFVEGVRDRYENVLIMWDLSHGPLLNEKPEVLKSYPDLIGHVHIGCAKAVNGSLFDWHPGFHRPGSVNDEEDVAELLVVLMDIGYKGAVGFEVKPEEGQSPLEVVHSAKSVLYTAFQLALT